MNRAPLPLHLTLHGSRWQRCFLASIHGWAIVSVWFMPAPAVVIAGLSGGLIISAVIAWRRSRHSKIQQIAFDGKNWLLVTCHQQTQKGRLLPSTWISRWLTLLHFRLQSGRFLAVPVWRDSVSDEAYRQLRVLLRWQVRF